MATGFCPALLTHINTLTECASPMKKVTPSGFLKMLLDNNQVADVSSFKDDGMGHVRDVNIKYAPRFLDSQTDTVASCDVSAQSAWLETSIPDPTLYRQFGLYISAADMAKYCADASATVMTDNKTAVPTKFMNEFMEQITRSANALIVAIDKDLLAKQLANFGRNARTGSNAATTLNFPLSTTTNDLNQGIITLLNDMSLNEACNDYKIVGSGLFNNFDLQQFMKCCAQNGVDTSKWNNYTFYHDINAAGAWGANQIGVFEDRAVQLIDINKNNLFTGHFTGGSQLFTMTLPLDCCAGGYESLTFDAQLKFIDCPTTVSIGGVPTTVNKGWVLTLGKAFDLWNIPANAYQATDRLFLNNGTYRYAVTNA